MTNLENYSEVFLKTFIDFSDFRQLFLANWQPDFFELPEESLIYKVLKNWWINGHKLPTEKDLLLAITSNNKFEKIKEKMIEKVQAIYAVDLSNYTESFVRDQFLELLKRNKLRFTVKKIVEEYNKTEKIDESAIKGEILKALEISNDLEDLGINYYDHDVVNRMKVLQQLQQTHFNTGFSKELDDVLRLKRKTVVAVSAQLGVGKSLFLNNLAVNISRAGHNVLYLSLEMDSFDISKRIDRIALGFQEDEYFNAADIVDQRMTETKKEYPKHGKLFIRSYSPRSLTSYQIRALLETYRLKNIGIDVILVDYLTLMKANKDRKDDSMYMRGKDVAEELRALAVDEKCLVFTALQVKNEAYGKNKQGSELVAESLAIPQILDTLINMVEVIIDEGDQKFFIINYEKIRDSKKTNKRIYLKLKDNLQIVDTTQTEKEKLEELVSKKKKTMEKIKNVLPDMGDNEVIKIF
jgi:replicative DNA helicase